ncbi:MAG: hypothetical protein WC691_04470 [Sulfuricurvum sp.]|jgi:hypothetical protein
MRKIPKPTFSITDVYDDCISKVSKATTKAELQTIKPLIVLSSINFDVAANNNTLHLFPTSTDVGGIPTKEMKKIYTYRMVHKDQGGRKYYDAILASAPAGKCPLCCIRDASTLDHHLPKKGYPDLVITPFNLVPACIFCNDIKDTLSPSTAEEETLHPYYDDIENEEWLYASVIQTQPLVIHYFVAKPDSWTQLLEDRASYHISKLGIDKLYSSHAVEELHNIRYRLVELFRTTGKDGVRAHLYESFESRYVNNINSWQTALYRALYQDDWFCDGGLTNI